MKEPANCADMREIRAEVDALDREIVARIGTRARYVHAAAKFKTSASAVRADERFAAMLQTRREWAIEENLNPDIIEKPYRELVTHFIQEETTQWNTTQTKQP